jgi:hypothetical protein
MDTPDKVLADDSVLLQEQVVRLFNSLFSDALNIISIRFPHSRGDGSEHETDFKCLRAKILRSGNNKLRKLAEVLGDYKIIKVYDTVVEKVEINTAVQKR